MSETLPADLEAERALIGAALLDPEARDAVVDLVGSADLYSARLRPVWEAIQHMHVHGRAIDAVTLADELRSRGALEAAGGHLEIAGLVQDVPVPSNGPRYAAIVRELADRRRAFKASMSFATEIKNGGDVEAARAALLDTVAAPARERAVTWIGSEDVWDAPPASPPDLLPVRGSGALLARHRVSLLFGAGDVGKTMVLYAELVRVATEGEAGLVVDGEMGLERVKTRVRDLLGASREAASRIAYAPMDTPPAELRRLARTGFALVVVDSVTGALRALRGSANDDVDIEGVLDTYGRQFARAGAAAVLIDHSGHDHQDRERGSSRKRQGVDVTLRMSAGARFAPGVEGWSLISVERDKDGLLPVMPGKVAARVAFRPAAGGLLEVELRPAGDAISTAPAPSIRVNAAERRLLEELAAAGGMLPTPRLAERLGKSSDATLAALKRLADRDLVRRLDAGGRDPSTGLQTPSTWGLSELGAAVVGTHPPSRDSDGGSSAVAPLFDPDATSQVDSAVTAVTTADPTAAGSSERESAVAAVGGLRSSPRRRRTSAGPETTTPDPQTNGQAGTFENPVEIEDAELLAALISDEPESGPMDVEPAADLDRDPDPASAGALAGDEPPGEGLAMDSPEWERLEGAAP